MEHGTVDNPLVFLTVGDDGWVTIVVHRSEMGQGVRTGMPLIVADEMEADWSKVRVQQAPADEEKYGNQDTDGSRSTRHFIDPMRRCGAAARMMLEQAAALSWNVPVTEVRALNHEVVHQKTGRKFSYGSARQTSREAAGAGRRRLALKDLRRVSLRRQGRGTDCRWTRYRHRPSAVRHRPLVQRHDASPSSRAHRYWAAASSNSTATPPPRRPACRKCCKMPAPNAQGHISSARRRRGHRQFHGCGHRGAQIAENRMG